MDDEAIILVVTALKPVAFHSPGLSARGLAICKDAHVYSLEEWLPVCENDILKDLLVGLTVENFS